MNVPADPDQLLRHAAWVRRLALRLCADAHAADDAAQDALIAAWRRPPVEADRLRGYLAASLRNVLAMGRRAEARRARREAAAARDQIVPDAAELLLRAELHQRLGELVLALPEPQRELVLRHYFDGENVPALAARVAMTQDAVRAHLRRARERLRRQLESGDERAARTFAALVAAVRPIGTGALTGATGVVLMTKTKLAVGAAVLVGLIAAVVVRPWWSPHAAGGRVPGAGRVATVAAEAGPVARPVEVPDAVPRTEVGTDARGAWSRTGRLEGLVAAAVWTSDLQLKVEGRVGERWLEHEAEAAVAADGTFSIELPVWALECERFELRLAADDPWYEPVLVTLDPREQRSDAPIVVPVSPVGIITGRVLDPAGAPVPAARVCVVDPRVMATVRQEVNTDLHGGFRLKTPIAAPVLLIALPMEELRISGRRFVSSGGGIPDAGVMRDDLLPASRTVAVGFGGEIDVGGLHLVAPVRVAGRVTIGGRTPLAGVEVRWDPVHERSVSVANETIVVREDGGVDRSDRAMTDADGAFELAAAAGSRGVVHTLHGTGIVTTAPAQVALDHADLVVLQVSEAGKPIAEMAVRLPWNALIRTDEHGEVRFLRRQREPIELEVAPPGRRIVPVVVPATPGGPVVVDLPIADTARVQIEFEAVHLVRHVRATLHRLDVEAEPLTAEQFRGPPFAPFEFELPIGTYRLEIGPPPRAERRDTFLVPASRHLEVTRGGTKLELPLVHGGRVRATVRDAQGRHPYATIALERDGEVVWRSTGGTRAARRTTPVGQRSGPVESANLPAGMYRLVVELDGAGRHTRTVEVVPLEVTEVRIDVP